MPKQVVITGIGLITPLGVGVEKFWSALISGESAIREAQRFDSAGLRTTHCAEIPPVDYDRWFEPRVAQLWTESTKMAVAGGLMAAEDAGLDRVAPRRMGVILGTGYGSIFDLDEAFRDFYQKDRRRSRPTLVPRMMANAPASHLAILLCARGPTFTLNAACSSGAIAIGLAVQQLRAGALECCLTGGYDLVLNRFDAAAWDGLRALSQRNDPTACRPFSEDRDGMILGEGCGALILETKDRALQRGAKIYGEILGVGISNDAHDIVQPGIDGRIEAIELALADAGLDSARIDFVQTHGTGTQMNDDNELEVLKRAFGARIEQLPITSIKGAIGHTMGAAGAIELAAAVLALGKGRIPPTLHLEQPPRGFNVVRTATDAPLNHALAVSFGFGGQNAAIVIGR